jgi:hypothetical protein
LVRAGADRWCCEKAEKDLFHSPFSDLLAEVDGVTENLKQVEIMIMSGQYVADKVDLNQGT